MAKKEIATIKLQLPAGQANPSPPVGPALGAHGVNFGLVAFGGTLGGALGPLVAGSIFDASGSYQLPFLLCAIAGIVVLALALALKRIKQLPVTLRPR